MMIIIPNKFEWMKQQNGGGHHLLFISKHSYIDVFLSLLSIREYQLCFLFVSCFTNLMLFAFFHIEKFLSRSRETKESMCCEMKREREMRKESQTVNHKLFFFVFYCVLWLILAKKMMMIIKLKLSNDHLNVWGREYHLWVVE